MAEHARACSGSEPAQAATRLKLPLACLALALLLGLARYVWLAVAVLRFPYEVDYGEGIVWQQLRMIVGGQGYAPLRPFPAIVFHYPPLYHLASAGMAQLSGIDQLAAGRLVSVLCTLLGAAMIGLIAAGFGPAGGGDDRNRLATRAGGLCAALAVLGTEPVLAWSVLMRVDMLFVAFSFTGLWLSIRALRQPGMIHGAALCFVGAIFTKQTAIAAPLAVFAVMVLVRPRTAFAGIATGLVTALAALALVMWQTGGEFLHHIIAYNINRFALVNGLDIPETVGKHIGLVAVAVVAILPRLRALTSGARAEGGLLAHLRTVPADAGMTMVLLHFALATAMMGMIFKSGSTINYFLEWIFLVALFAGLGISDFVRWAGTGQPNRLMAALPWVVAVETVAFGALFETDYSDRAPFVADYQRIATVMRAAPAPIISDDMVLLLRAGKPVVMEPSIFAELSATHVLDDRPLLAKIAAGQLAFVLTEHGPGDPYYDSRYTPALTHAILKAYPQTVVLADSDILRFPAGDLPTWAAALKVRSK